MGKLSTPDWIKEGYDSPQEYNKVNGVKTVTPKKTVDSKGKTVKSGGKTYKVKICPKCSSSDVGVVLRGEEGKRADEWECRKCKWTGRNISEKELNEDDFLKLMGEK